MPKSTETPRFSVIPGAGTLEPPVSLGPAGAAFWRETQATYHIDDVGGRELLFQICSAKDRIASIAEEIARDGTVIRSRTGVPRSHPAMRDELANRSFVAKGLERLGISSEPVRSVGAPPRPFGWQGDR
jgi:hypothetical protein